MQKYAPPDGCPEAQGYVEVDGSAPGATCPAPWELCQASPYMVQHQKEGKEQSVNEVTETGPLTVRRLPIKSMISRCAN